MHCLPYILHIQTDTLKIVKPLWYWNVQHISWFQCMLVSRSVLWQGQLEVISPLSWLVAAYFCVAVTCHPIIWSVPATLKATGTGSSLRTSYVLVCKSCIVPCFYKQWSTGKPSGFYVEKKMKKRLICPDHNCFSHAGRFLYDKRMNRLA